MGGRCGGGGVGGEVWGGRCGGEVWGGGGVGGEVCGELSNPITTRSLENYCSPK